VPIDHATCKTGISPFERCATIHAVVDEDSKPGDFVRPGHLFPLVARDGGVLVRPGHTEASVDLGENGSELFVWLTVAFVWPAAEADGEVQVQPFGPNTPPPVSEISSDPFLHTAVWPKHAAASQ
jgi:hypothetical protein